MFQHTFPDNLRFDSFHSMLLQLALPHHRRGTCSLCRTLFASGVAHARCSCTRTPAEYKYTPRNYWAFKMGIFGLCPLKWRVSFILTHVQRTLFRVIRMLAVIMECVLDTSSPIHRGRVLMTQRGHHVKLKNYIYKNRFGRFFVLPV